MYCVGGNVAWQMISNYHLLFFMVIEVSKARSLLTSPRSNVKNFPSWVYKLSVFHGAFAQLSWVENGALRPVSLVTSPECSVWPLL